MLNPGEHAMTSTGRTILPVTFANTQGWVTFGDDGLQVWAITPSDPDSISRQPELEAIIKEDFPETINAAARRLGHSPTSARQEPRYQDD